MAKSTIIAARTERAHARALEVVREHGPEERAERLDDITVGQAVTRNPQHLAGFQAELIAALSEIVEDQDRRISKLEKAAKASAKSGK